MSPQSNQKLQYLMSLINSSTTGQAEANEAMLSGNPAAGAELGAMAGAVNTGGLGRGLTTARKMASSGNTPFSQLNISEEAMLNPQPSPQQRYDELQYLGSQGPLSNEEIDEFIMLRNQMNPNLPQERPVTMPVDIDGASVTGMTQEELNILLKKIDRMR